MSTNRPIALAIASGLMASIGSAITGQHELMVKHGYAQPRLAPPATRRESRTRSAGSLFFGYKTGPGWTAAHVKRMAKKRKNQIRNRRAHRG